MSDYQNFFLLRQEYWFGEQLIKKADIFPIEFIVRNISTGSLTKRLGIPEGTHLEKPLLEYCYKKDELNDPLISREHILSFGWATEKEIKIIDNMTLRINDLLTGMFRAVGIKLVDFKIDIIEFNSTSSFIWMMFSKYFF